ncbi:hypothetical protein [Tessaracoccus coleopterorum]|uniref:hypothetical protein n=1 Tax=Tessaracoccus coleopterorum TaxID=2714950 RepID=UPI002F918AA0
MAEAVVVEGLDGALAAARFLDEGELGRAPLVVAGATRPAPRTALPGPAVRDLIDAPAPSPERSTGCWTASWPLPPRRRRPRSQPGTMTSSW